MINSIPYNSFPASTAKFEEGKNDLIQEEIDAMKDGKNIDSFGDVETALSLKANTADMTTALATKTNLSNIAPTFDSESGVYAIGDKVIYEGVLYEFTSAHETAGDWDSSEVQAVKISELIDTLKSGLTYSAYGAIDTATVFFGTLVKESDIAFLKVEEFVSLINGSTILTEKIPEGYRPKMNVEFTLVQRNMSFRPIAFAVKTTGDIHLYNYGSEIDSRTAFGDTLSWPIGS